MSPIKVHLICNAHLDPVWQWRWDEGASEALATFRNAVDILDEHPALVFCHNEAVLYQWVERFDPALFDDIRRLVKAGRWAISGGWFIQPDVNLPGAESIIRSIAEGRRYFRDRFDAAPRVAYNFDSFGHGGGLPQILRQAGYEMYIHMRPQAGEFALPADLYRWRGVDGTTIPAYRIAVGLYHTEHDNVEDRLRAGVDLALELGRDVPVFWGLGNHGGGATRRDLRTIDAFMARESRVHIIHSTPDRFCDAVADTAAVAPIHDGDLQRCFTGCYTSLSRLKRQAVSSLGRLVRAETAAAASSWLTGAAFPEDELREAWKLHLFNDFHDILPGTCIEPAERDALAGYGAAETAARKVELGAVSALNRGGRASPPLPVTVFNANPSLRRVPVEFECMADHRPFWKGLWRMRLFRADGREVACQEEQPESLLPFNNWRRRISFVDSFAGVGVARYELRAFEIGKGAGERRAAGGRKPVPSPSVSRLDPAASGLIAALAAFARHPAGGPLFGPLVVEDTADSWGTGYSRYRKVVGRFKPLGPPGVVEDGAVRTITRAVLGYRASRIVLDAVTYPTWPVVEVRFRVTWNEPQRRLKLAVPTGLVSPRLTVEVPGGAIERPADGEEHVHGRWLVVEGRAKAAAKKRGQASKASVPLALGIASSGQHGLDFKDGELRLSVLRSNAYCHERGFDLGKTAIPITGTVTSNCPQWKFADLGVHEFRLLVTAGVPASVKAMMPGLADHLAAPPAAYPHLPYGPKNAPAAETLFSVKPANVRLLACKRSGDGQALVIRLQEATGKKTRAELCVALPADAGRDPRQEHTSSPSIKPSAGGLKAWQPSRGRHQEWGQLQVTVPISFAPFEIKTLRVDTDGRAAAVRLIEETPL